MNVKRKIAVMALAVCLTVAMMPFFTGQGVQASEFSSPTELIIGNLNSEDEGWNLSQTMYFKTDSTTGVVTKQDAKTDDTTITYTPSDGSQVANLVLNNATIKKMSINSGNDCAAIYSNNGLWISVYGNNVIDLSGNNDFEADSYSGILESEGNLEIIGAGAEKSKLDVIAPSDAKGKLSIAVHESSPSNNVSLKTAINDVELNATGGSNAFISRGIQSDEQFSVVTSKIKASAGSASIESTGLLCQSDFNLLTADDAMTISAYGGTCTSTGSGVTSAGIDAEFKTITIGEGCSLTAKGGTAVNSYGITKGTLNVEDGSATVAGNSSAFMYSDSKIGGDVILGKDFNGDPITAYSTANYNGTGTRTGYLKSDSAKSVDSSQKYFRAGLFVSEIKIISELNERLELGKTMELYPSTIPVYPTNGKLTWTSSNTAIATVNSKGKITARHIGTVKITGKAVDYCLKPANVTITLMVVPNKSVSYSKTKVYIQGDYIKITWPKVSGISKYQAAIYSSDYGKTTYTKKIVKTTTNSYKFRWKSSRYYDVQVAVVQTYKGVDYPGLYTEYKCIFAKPSSSVTKLSRTRVTVKWVKYNEKYSHVSYYQIKVAKNSKMTKGVKYYNVNKKYAYKTIASLSKGQDYYFKVRAKVQYAVQPYTPWSTTHHVKM